MDLDLRLVRYFVAVADELHFGRAAASLYISQPALSKQIRKLEEQLGAPLLVRDSRHVTLTARGQRFLDEARTLLSIAERMQQENQPGVLRVAHVFELATSRIVVDAYTSARKDIQLIESALDSVGQLHALLDGLLDVAIMRVTPQMLADRPSGWRHRLLRLEPMRLVGRPGDVPRESVSLHERPIEVFADARGSGLYNAHGDYLSAFERHTGLRMRWLGTPGAFSHCLAALMRAEGSAFLFESDSYADKYAAAGLPVHQPTELHPHYPWSLAWRDEPPARPVADYLDIALETADRLDWQRFSARTSAPAWLPADDPAAPELTRR
ncbi:LysR family transcriptional regulator [Actinophytocola sp.]|jgi:DNA-binding transcriptional LysR family regulator|uniref:LysR family transcriptional regulator n=1 Tax=Actinophytocola sp. TaxID=1872138 RepID=UPI002EDA542C